MKKLIATGAAVIFTVSAASAAVAPGQGHAELPSKATPAVSMHHQDERVAFARDCGDSLWKFSLIEAITCVVSGQWPSQEES